MVQVGSVIIMLSLAVSNQVYGQTNFKIINSWGFEYENVDQYTIEEIKEDFNVSTVYSHTDYIVTDTLNAMVTKVLKATHKANELWWGTQITAFLDNERTAHNEIYLSYNMKFGAEWNSTGGGKLPGLRGLPAINNPPADHEGFYLAPMFKEAGRIISYHYTHGGEYANPWSYESYDHNTVYLNNGQWYNITQRVVKNTFTNGKANYDGINEIWVDGRLIFQEKNLRLLVDETKGIDAMFVGHYYGGASDGYRPKHDCDVFLDNIVVWLPTEDNIKGQKLHDPSIILRTPVEISDRRVYYDTLITSEGDLHNFEFGKDYSPCIDETYLIDAGEGNTVNYQIKSGVLGGGDYLFFYDGNKSDSKMIGMIEGYESSLARKITSTGRYLFIRFSSNTDGGTTGFSGNITFNKGITSEGDNNNSPTISNQIFTINESTFRDNFVGRIIAGDIDINQSLTYSIISGNESGLFGINSSTGNLTTTKGDVFSSTETSLNLVVKVTDNGVPSKSSSATIAVSFIPAREVAVNAAPVIKDQEFIIRQNEFESYNIGRILAYDTDNEQTLSYYLVSGNESGIFKLNSESGNLTTTTSNVFNGTKPSYDLVVRVDDNGSEIKSSLATIRVSFIAESGNVYIDPENISDPNENGSIAHPFDSWKDVAWKDGTIYLQKCGTTAKEDKIIIGASNVTIGAYGSGEKPVITSETTSYLISGFDKHNITISNIQVECAIALSCIYFLGNSCDNIIVEQCIFESPVNAIRIVEGIKATIKYNTFIGETEGVYSTANETNIFYNIFKENNTAVNIMGNESIANIYNNVFVDNGQSVSASYAELVLYNNIFYMSGQDQRAISYNSDRISSDHNIFYPIQDGFIQIANKLYNSLDQIQQSLSIDLHSFSSDPLFVNMLSDDYSLMPGSPATNSGFSIDIDRDFFGQLVPVAGKPDIGISESTVKAGTFDPLVFVYPNPSSGTVNVDIQENTQNQNTNPDYSPSSLKVVDMFGKAVLSRLLDNQGSTFMEQIDLTGHANGIYFIVYQIADKVFTQKLILHNQ